MGDLSTIASALGLGFVAGFRLYLTVLALGLAMRFHLLSAQAANLGVLADTRILIAAAALCVIEFFADKVPWVDSLWDSVHTVIRPRRRRDPRLVRRGRPGSRRPVHRDAARRRRRFIRTLV